MGGRELLGGRMERGFDSSKCYISTAGVINSCDGGISLLGFHSFTNYLG